MSSSCEHMHPMTSIGERMTSSSEHMASNGEHMARSSKYMDCKQLRVMVSSGEP